MPDEGSVYFSGFAELTVRACNSCLPRAAGSTQVVIASARSCSAVKYFAAERNYDSAFARHPRRGKEW